MKKIFKIALAILTVLGLKSCSDDNNIGESENPPVTITKKEVIDNYAKLVYQNYLGSYNAAVILQTSIKNFTDAPSQNGLDKVKADWLAAREIYGQSEVFRGSNGPVDSEGGESWAVNNEGQMNAWPLDEGYIDYVTPASDAYSGYSSYNGGIIAGTSVINETLLIDKNEKENDKSISTGWHAIEFLIWGQDETNPSELKAGQRPLTDYTTDTNKERRKVYLNVVTSILVKDLKKLVDTWAQGGEYYSVFMGLSEKEALINILSGPFFLANEELSEERMLKPVDLTDGIDNSGQEDEHSCFSDNTHRDVVTNAQGIINVLFGTYGTIKGASIYDLIKQEDAALANNLKTAADAMMLKINEIDSKANNNKPFDLLLQEESISDPGTIVSAGSALKSFGGTISEGALKIGISLN